MHRSTGEGGGDELISSRKIAEEFGRRHSNVLQSIDRLKADVKTLGRSHESKKFITILGDEFITENFFEHKYKDASGKMSREILMTKVGAGVVVMRFTTRKAIRSKVEMSEALGKVDTT